MCIRDSYWDRNTAADVGRYKAVVADLWFPYVKPQETGNRTDTRWVTFTNSAGVGWNISGAPTFYFSAWPFRMAELLSLIHILPAWVLTTTVILVSPAAHMVAAVRAQRSSAATGSAHRSRPLFRINRL